MGWAAVARMGGRGAEWEAEARSRAEALVGGVGGMLVGSCREVAARATEKAAGPVVVGPAAAAMVERPADRQGVVEAMVEVAMGAAREVVMEVAMEAARAVARAVAAKAAEMVAEVMEAVTGEEGKVAGRVVAAPAAATAEAETVAEMVGVAMGVVMAEVARVAVRAEVRAEILHNSERTRLRLLFGKRLSSTSPPLRSYWRSRGTDIPLRTADTRFRPTRSKRILLRSG